jgi:acyl transferase domain-containing protein/NAD(P)H-dependent flavin oxidoreductase YrpB (nitropropane dioxygenase family)/NAD(P)-dependent dehydrogenase (short-subunit alcohol dehydrogenase family)/acyl carrier protein
MVHEREFPIVAFVWRHQDITSSVVEAARRTAAKAVFDLTRTDPASMAGALLKADASNETVHLKVSPEALLDPRLEELLSETGIHTVWVELHPASLDKDAGPYLDRMLRLATGVRCCPVVSDLGLIHRVIHEFPRITDIALKGSEAAGFVSGENLFTLYEAVRVELLNAGRQCNVVTWGGIATPEAAAAFLAAGAAGVIFESVHWLTDLVSLGDEARDRIGKLRPEHTDLTGLNLQVPCRLFNKGNSRAVKELRDFAGSLCGAEIRDEQRRFFAHRIEEAATDPLESHFSRDELLPLGVEAAFAHAFVRRFGSNTEQAIDRFIKEIETACSRAGEKEKAFSDSPVAKEMGTQYPFIQGAMSWITDVPEFAVKVADAGALPTLALGLMDGRLLEEKLGRVREILGERPYAVNVITLQENPFRDQQLAWIRTNKPRFAVIAAGEPSHARELLESGIEVIYIAPNEELLKLAFEAGVRYVICEGNEAGGHVGEHSTLTLAQMVIDLKNREPDLCKGRRVILAGGICNRETAFMAAMLGADAVQMGTCYLTTREIVETGALSELYRRMILQAVPGSSVITGEGTGLRVRSLRTPRIEAVCSLERDFAAGSEDESSFRHKIEQLTAGSLLIAARGIDGPGGLPLDEPSCIEKGQFMTGASAGVLSEIRSLEELHRDLADSPLPVGLPFQGPVRESLGTRERPEAVHVGLVAGGFVARKPTIQAPERERIAITGMSIVNSLGNSPEEVWAASKALRCGIIPVPPERWDHQLYFDPRPRTPEKTYCKVGAFQHIEVSRKDLGIPPQDFRTMTDSTKVTMWLAKQAVEASRILESDIPKERIAVLISQNSGEAAATLQDVIIRGRTNELISAMKTAIQLDPVAEEAAAEAVKCGRIVIDDTTLLGRLNCAAAGFICNKYGFQGPSFAVSAACATALVALYSAYQMIRNGIIDAAVVGGAEESLTPMHFLEFSALGALAGLSGVERAAHEVSRPFDADRDGMVLGEGGGMIVIERESVARSRGARIHAYITAMGASNNHLGMVESSRVTQEIAIAASFADAPYGPEGVDLVECHATSTRQGDVEEVHALRKFYGPDQPVALTSFKSQIGHTLGASGVNSLIRGVMAMKDRVLPPSINYQTPDPDMELDESGISIATGFNDWKTGNGRPRRFQVNAFGFGGSNYVLQVEESGEDRDAVLVSIPEPDAATGQASPEADLPRGLHLYNTEIGHKIYRMGVVADDEPVALELVEKAEPIGNGGPVPAKRVRALARQGIHIGLAEGAPPPLALVFPGQGSHYAGMAHELYETFPVIREWMDRIAEVAEFDILRLLFYDREEDLQKTRWQQPALFTMEYAMARYLVSLGIRPVAMAGHSLGELTALCLAGVYSFKDGFRIVNKRAVCMDKACEMNADPGIMMAVDAPLDYLEEKLRHLDKVYVTNINSPNQVVLGGDTDAVTALGEELKAEGYRRTKLRVSMAFHSPIMACIHDELEEFIAGIPFHAPQIPVISNTTMMPFPDDPVEMKRIVMAHLESPVHWMQNARTLWDDYGVRLYVEVGPRDILSNLITDSIPDAECLQTCLPSAESLIYRTALAQLYARGNLKPRTRPKFVAFAGKESRPDASAAAPASQHTVSMARATGAPGAIEWVVQREINSFLLETFGRFLKPSILAAIRREVDPNFSEEKLETVLRTVLPSMTTPTMSSPKPMPVTAASVAPVAAAPTGRAAAAVQAPAGEEDVTEAVIRIIMEATGYERDEIEPDMDLREDLSIRSSRLPVIMDAVENHFSIKIELEQFMDVRTIREVADTISAILARKHSIAPRATADSPAGPSVSAAAGPVPVEEPVQKTPTSTEQEPIKRLVFREVPLEEGSSQPVELDTLESVVVYSAEGGTGMRRQVAEVFRRDYGVNLELSAFGEAGQAGDECCDLSTDSGAAAAENRLREVESLAGTVFIIDDLFESKNPGVEDLSRLLTGFFRLLKVFLESPARKFCLLIHRTEHPEGMGRVLAEGVLGMFLSLAHEFSSVQFRTVRVDEKTDLRSAIRGALDRSRKVVEIIYRGGEAFTTEGRVEPLVMAETQSVELGPESVVVISGGGYGVTSYLARSLVPFGCRMVFLGRSTLDPDIDFRELMDSTKRDPDAAARMVKEAKPGISAGDLEREVAKVAKTVEIIRFVEELRGLGIDASYYTCDVADPQRAAQVMGNIVKRYRRIDGVIHGAGLLRDNFLRQMSTEDFARVTAVKFLGAWNLYRAAQPAGLRFFVCLSSGASIQGNPGQVNYSAGNRIMSALVDHLRGQHDEIFSRALMLSPIEGTGMAENEEVRALMKRMNAAYIHAEELACLFTRELTLGPKDDTWVMFMRSLPDLPTVRLQTSLPASKPDKIDLASVTFDRDNFPLIDAVTSLDLRKGELLAARTFSQERDPWIADHKPFKFLKYPLVSAIMALETFMESSKILYPSLHVHGVRDARFLDIITCPPGVERESEIACRRESLANGRLVCGVTLASREISPSGRLMDRVNANYQAQVVLGARPATPPDRMPGFPVMDGDLDSRPMLNDEVVRWYSDRTDMQGRYRLMEEIHGSGPDAVRGRIVYRTTEDFAPPRRTRYQFSPYLLEALMQVANFYVIMRDQNEQRSMIPFRIGRIDIFRQCLEGEEITVEARISSRTDEGITWAARGVDRDGKAVMTVQDMVMRWFSA